MSTFMDEETFETDPNTDTLNPRSDFLKNIEDSIDMGSNGRIAK